MADARDMARDTVLLTYEELAGRLGIDVQSARKRALRSRWARTRGNDGRARVHVPVTVLQTVHGTVSGTDGTSEAPAPPTEAPVAPGVPVTPEVLSHLLAQAGQVPELQRQLGEALGEARAFRETLERAEAQVRDLTTQTAEFRQALGRMDRQAQDQGVRAAQLEMERDAARGELESWTAGGPLARAVRAFLNRRGRP